VNSDYSIRVQNSKGSLVYSAPQATERYSEVVFGANAEDVLYDPPFTNAVQTNVEAKLAQTVSVKDFGAVGDGVTDDTVALQNFFNFCALNQVELANWSGNYRITQPINYVPIVVSGTPTQLTKRLVGRMQLNTTAAIEYMFRLAGNHITADSLYLTGSRTATKVGLYLGGGDIPSTINTTLRDVFAANFKNEGISVRQNALFAHIENSRVANIGALAETASYSSFSRNSIGDQFVNQFTTISVGAQPPSKVTLDGSASSNTFVKIDSQIYQLIGTDSTAGTITVRPWVFSPNASGTLSYIYGAGVHQVGNNTGAVTFGTVAAAGCGIGFSQCALYTGVVNNLVTEVCGVGYTEGALISDPSFNFQINRSYFEANTFDYVPIGVTQLSLNKNSFNISAPKTVNLGNFSFRDVSGNISRTQLRSTELGIGLSANDTNYFENNGEITSIVQHKIIYSNFYTMNLALDSEIKKLFGKSSITYTFQGDGANGGITSLTINPPLGYTINGAASLVFANTNSAVTLTISLSPFVATDIRVSMANSSGVVKKDTTANGPSGTQALGLQYFDTTLDPDGKPIWWNGVAWVDATGAVV
jgi:hypothetical protein